MLNVIETVAERWIWFVLVLMALSYVFFRQAAHARRTAKESIFGLEREQELRRAAAAQGRMLVVLALAAGVYGLYHYGVPLLPSGQDEAVPSATAVPSRTATSSTPVQFPFGTVPITMGSATAMLKPTVTLTPGSGSVTPEATATPAAVQVPASCPNVGVQITSPGSGAGLSGVVTVSGTASIDGFQFYKLELSAGDQPGSWSVIGDTHASPVQGGALGSWDTSSLPPGQYWLRLVVVDQSGNYPDPCQIRVSLRP